MFPSAIPCHCCDLFASTPDSQVTICDRHDVILEIYDTSLGRFEVAQLVIAIDEENIGLAMAYDRSDVSGELFKAAGRGFRHDEEKPTA